MKKAYTYYFYIIFLFFFLLTFPIQLVLVQKKEWHELGHLVNKKIIRLVFFFTFIKVSIEHLNLIERNKKYIFCTNHSSYIDILALYQISDNYFKFLGKDSLEKIPLFGYMYRRLYITVNRRNQNSRTEAIDKCDQTLKSNISLAIFPEGAIPITTPKLIHFKDGAFKLSIENNVPIVPITMPLNHNVLPVGGFFKSREIKIIIHEPLNTNEKAIQSIQELKNETFEVIEAELKKYGIS